MMGGAGGAWGAIAQGVTDVASSALGQWQQNEAADLAWKRWRKRYQSTVRDLKKAGLNPILAVSNGLAGGNVPMGGSIGAPKSNIGNSINSAMMLKTEQNRMAKETELLDEKIRTEKDIQYEASERGNLHANQAQEILRKLPGVSDKLMEEINNLRANSALAAAREANERAQLPRYEFESSLGGMGGRLFDAAGNIMPDVVRGLFNSAFSARKGGGINIHNYPRR